MTKKMKKESGFTLVEMLIVVAIIAILIAVSIPLVSSALEKAREATDAANERSFKAVLLMAYLTEKVDDTNDFEKSLAYAYDAANGVLKTTEPAVYGQSTTGAGDSTVDAEGKFLVGSVSATGEIKMAWASTVDHTADVTAGKLVSEDLLPTAP